VGEGDNRPAGWEEVNSLANRLDNLLDAKEEIQEDIKALTAEVKAKGYPVSAWKAVVAERRKDREKLQEFYEAKAKIAAALNYDVFE